MIRYGIVGFGLHAVRRMMPAFANAKQSKAVALTRRDAAKAKENAREYNIPLVFGTTEELCASPEVDAVFVTTPNHLHLSDVLTAIKHGKHVLCEKPLAMNADECRQMVDAAKAANIQFGVAHVFRFCYSVEYMREKVAQLGKIATAHAEFHYPGLSHQRTWINDKAIGGGTVADIGVHCIDTLRYVLRDEVVRVQAQARCDAQSGDVDAYGSLILEFSRGTMATVSVSMRAQYYTQVGVTGENATLSSNYGISVDSPIHVNVLQATKLVESREFANYDAYTRMLDAFSVSIDGGPEFCAPGVEGLRNQIILDAAYESAATGMSVALLE